MLDGKVPLISGGARWSIDGGMTSRNDVAIRD